jgi:uncharacterized protein YbjT (DUF2867 family)
MSKPIIAVFGATGAQGGGVVRALSAQGKFRVRALTRDPSKAAGLADEVVAADLTRPDSLPAALEGAHGVFLVTNFWERGTDEIAQGRAAVEAAKAAGVSHFVWSTLPDVEQISGGRFHVPHFTNKAKVDALVRAAGFEHSTFVKAPFYFQNLQGVLGPQPMPDGARGWVVPLPAAAKVIHMGDIGELGQVVAGAFANPERVGAGAMLAHAAGTYSFEDVAAAFRARGHDLVVREVPAEVYATFYPGADEMAQMMLYWAAHTYMGPDAEAEIARAREVATGTPTSLSAWVDRNIAAP